MADQNQHEMRRDLSKLGTDLARGMGAAHLMIEQVQRSVTDVTSRFDTKSREDHAREVTSATERGVILTKLEELRRDLDALAGLPERVVKLETGHEHIKSDVTGKHTVEKAHVESKDKKEERELEAKKIASEERRSKRQFWSAILVVALPGVIAVILQLVGYTPPEQSLPEIPAVAAPSHHE